MVGHLTREYSRIAWYFLACGGSISVKASSHRQHCKQLSGGMEIPSWVTFTCSRKGTLNWLKALLKVVIYANSGHGVQMFSQISRIPDLIRKFWAKKCGLYAGVYGIYWLKKTLSISINDGSTLITAGSYLITSLTSFALPPICRNFSLTGLTWILSSGRNISGSARYKKKAKQSPILRLCWLSSVTKTHIMWASLNTWTKWKQPELQQNDTIMTFHYILFISGHSDTFHSLQLISVFLVSFQYHSGLVLPQFQYNWIWSSI